MSHVDEIELSESRDETSEVLESPAVLAEHQTDSIVNEEPEAAAESADGETEPVIANVIAPDVATEAEVTESADVSELPADAAPDANESIQAEAQPDAPASPLSPEERVCQLEAEVNAAPHKVYSLGKVRRVLTELKSDDAGETLLERLSALESGIQAQIGERKAAKESICEQAEALQDSTEWRATGDKLRGLFEQWKQIGSAGKKLDDELWQRFIAARERFGARRTEHFDERKKVWAVAQEKKEALIAQAEELNSSTEWRSTADKIRNLQDQWKQAGSAGREADDTLWTRFNAAKQVFFDNRTASYETHRQQKEALCLEAEALKDSSDWRLTGDAMKAMQARWKEIGAAGRAVEDQLWERFRAATNAFFERREQAFSGRRQEERENLVKKQELVAKVEALVYASDGLAAAREAKDLQAQWKAVGHANREQSDALWARFRGACDRIFESASSERDRQQTAWQGRMKDAMTRKREQLASTRESIEHDEANLARWRASLSEMRPGGKSSEIEASLDAKIMDVIDRIRAKQDRVEELRATIADMEAKLRD